LDQYKTLASTPWNNSDLIERLVELGSLQEPLEIPTLAKDLLSLGCQQAPETLLLGFSKLSSWPSSPNTSGISALKDLLNSLLLAFLQGNHSSASSQGGNTSLVLPLLWQNSPSLFVTGCIYLYNSDPSSLSRVLDLAQEIKV
jgi:CCR4-NOT transcription complex subunit 1